MITRLRPIAAKKTATGRGNSDAQSGVRQRAARRGDLAGVEDPVSIGSRGGAHWQEGAEPATLLRTDARSKRTFWHLWTACSRKAAG